MISSQNEHIFIRDLSNLTLQIIFVSVRQWMYARNVLLLGVILEIRLHNNFISTKELRRLAAPESYVSFLIKFFAIHQNIGPAQLGNTCCQKITTQS